MGGTSRSSIGHILPGTGFFAVGLWHLFNHIRLFSLRPDSYVAPVWFPVPRARWRYLEPALVIAGSALEFAMEMFVDHSTFLPFDADGSIPADRLHNHEHAIICLSLVVYAGAAVHLDRRRSSRGRPAPGARALCLLLASVVFAQELLVFHFHSTNHAGVEGQFHWCLQAVVAACLATSLLGIGFPRSFAVSVARSACVMFHGVWLAVIGAMVWVPALVPKGCYLVRVDGRDTVRCRGEASLRRAKALVNLQFGWYLSFLTVFVLAMYLYVCSRYPAHQAYARLPTVAGGEEEGHVEEARKCGAPRDGGGDVHGDFASLEIEV
ncbi:uncharacterized protein LOC100846845 [Brachypodium distachyon]|uniref:Uncharacterized protein n=1 Tax=Brachypodium distachyon TaxID=15368 RepID=I1IQJ6_BRADI|nr:uncharacterized protein LOC100846845 [Brachypodium distachyon]PNT64692.1 hypothetical protein BRADI_4g31572v3 [Brachypodium distachyon]|eukprot:XP_003576582.1 uncharacterized protein LOC100846845 [Brachypodium distachyon]